QRSRQPRLEMHGRLAGPARIDDRLTLLAIAPAACPRIGLQGPRMVQRTGIDNQALGPRTPGRVDSPVEQVPAQTPADIPRYPPEIGKRHFRRRPAVDLDITRGGSCDIRHVKLDLGVMEDGLQLTIRHMRALLPDPGIPPLFLEKAIEGDAGFNDWDQAAFLARRCRQAGPLG